MSPSGEIKFRHMIDANCEIWIEIFLFGKILRSQQAIFMLIRTKPVRLPTLYGGCEANADAQPLYQPY
ncbi:hypothetical protein [Janthinobacterium aquaticum]|uniref:hypothetical protein n=1 Tax=Janthinobacterium sp. FT58W TaxID=2654254 RepID=UPI001264CD1D|nr:hypothetical protein [Janthinobacterium sp. FT58W]